MKEFKCPQKVCDIFETNPEEGRKKAIEWLETLPPLASNDRVWMPHGITGKLKEWIKQTEH